MTEHDGPSIKDEKQRTQKAWEKLQEELGITDGMSHEQRVMNTQRMDNTTRGDAHYKNSLPSQKPLSRLAQLAAIPSKRA